MSSIQVGELYKIKKFHWVIYSQKEYAHSDISNWYYLQDAKSIAELWSQKCETYVAKKNSILVFLEEKRKYKKVLTSGGDVGWIIISPQDLLDSFELYKEEQK